MSTHFSARRLAQLSNKLGVSTPVPPARKPRDNEESRNQQATVRWFDMMAPTYRLPPFVLFAISNGGWRDPIGARILKLEGLRPGVCDLFLSVPKRGLHGLYIEMKTKTGRIATEQKDFINTANALGYRAVVCYSADEAVAEISEYLA